ncbi:MAG TPA: 2-hydroxyacyl-CoA dehydratase family protein [bacterium]|nr:2-hydroxyacyl-CoA dehydratase family protein [bacterium]
MSDLMAPFYEVLADRHGWLAKYKAQSGRRIAGYFCDYVPEEILYAAGLVPVRMTGGQGNVIAADRYLQSSVCSFARRCFDQALTGVYGYLDALITAHGCDVITKMYDLWAYRMKDPAFVHYLWVPHKVFDKDAPMVMEGEVKRLRKCVEEFRGSPITDEAIADAIAVYDQSRALLKRVYELRRGRPPAISGVEAFSVALSAQLMPRELHNQWVEALLAEREGKPSTLDDRPRVIVSASMIDDLQVVRAIEDAGAWVVADDLCTGSRYFWDQVGDPAPNPVKALTRRYLNKLPCPRSVDSLQPRLNHIQNLARDYSADGIIFYILRCCDAHLFQYPILNQRMQEAGLRVLYIQGDQTVGINEAIVNRIKAFTEMLVP